MMDHEGSLQRDASAHCVTFCFFNDTATTEIYTLSLHDALPISPRGRGAPRRGRRAPRAAGCSSPRGHPRYPKDPGDRKSTRLNSSHANISYAVFCLKKKTSEHQSLPYVSSLKLLENNTFYASTF